MRTAITALTEELRRLKSSGVSNVSLSTESLERLHAAVKKRIAAEPMPKVEETQPVSARTAVRQKQESKKASLPLPPKVQLPDGNKEAQWSALREMVLNDETCREQVRPGKQVVVGVGNLEAKIMFVGEAPGADEEIKGEPFVGPAGQLLTKMIGAMGMKRADVYIGNIMNWRPQLPTREGAEQIGNRPPDAEEMAYCLPYLRAQIEIVSPAVIVALGATAARGLLGFDAFRTLGEVRGKWHEFADTPLMVTYHPSYILRNQSNRSKRAIWEDLLQVMEKAAMSITDKQRGYFANR